MTAYHGHCGPLAEVPGGRLLQGGRYSGDSAEWVSLRNIRDSRARIVSPRLAEGFGYKLRITPFPFIVVSK